MGLLDFLFNRGFTVSNKCILDVIGFSNKYLETRKVEIDETGDEVMVDYNGEGHIWFVWGAMKDAGYDLSKKQIESIVERFCFDFKERENWENISGEEAIQLIQKACPEANLNFEDASCLYKKCIEYDNSHSDDEEKDKEEECSYIYSALRDNGVSISRESVWKILSRVWWELDETLWGEFTTFVPWTK